MASAVELTGHWQGRIQIPNHELAISVDLAKEENGSWIGSMSVTGSGTIDVPLLNVTFVGDAVQFQADLPGRTTFNGHLSADAARMEGAVANAQGDAPFQLTRSGEAKVKVPPPSSPLTREFEGEWQGSLESGGKVRRVGLKLTPAKAALIALDHDNLEIPITTVTIADRQLQLEARSISGTFRGMLRPDNSISGEWTEGTVRSPLTFKRVP